jgi:hypothetical protein
MSKLFHLAIHSSYSSENRISETMLRVEAGMKNPLEKCGVIEARISARNEFEQVDFENEYI